MIRLTPRGLVASDLVTEPVGRRSAHVLSRFDGPARSPAFWFASPGAGTVLIAEVPCAS